MPPRCSRTSTPNSTIRGLNETPEELQPPANVVHISFQLMVGLGLSISGPGRVRRGWARWRNWVACPTSKWFLRACVAAGPAAVLAMEAGWTTTEVGRQPYIAQGVMLVEEAVTPRQGVALLVVGLLHSVRRVWRPRRSYVLRNMSARWRRGEDAGTPYGPEPLPDDPSK